MSRTAFYALVTLSACTAAVRPAAAPLEPVDGGMASDAGVAEIDAGPPPQPGSVIAVAGDTAVVALDAPPFAAVSREQRLLAYWTAQAARPLDAVGWKAEHLEVARLLRGILSKPALVQPAVLTRIRDFARTICIHRGLRDSETGRKLAPPFSMPELRDAALAAQAAGADLHLQGGKLEFRLRSLEGLLFSPQEIDAKPVPLGDTRALPAAAALDQALPYGTPSQRALLEALAAHLRSQAPLPAWADPQAPVLFWVDERGSAIGLHDSEALLFLGGTEPLQSPAFTRGGRAALFTAATTPSAVALLADPALSRDLSRCLQQHRRAYWSLRETAGRAGEPIDPTLDETRADVTAWSSDPPGMDPRCQELWPQFAATLWFASAAHLPQGDRVTDPRQRAVQLQIWWFSGKGAITERHDGQRRFLSADPARFQRTAAELLAVLQDIARTRDMLRLRDLLEAHASRVDPHWRDEVIDRLQKAGIPRRTAVLPPALEPVIEGGKVVDAKATPIRDLDAHILDVWSSY